MARVGRLVKESSVKELSTELSDRPNFFVTTINRLPSVEADALRQKLYASQAKLVVIQRRLGQRVLEQLKLDGLTDLLQGSVGLVLPGEDVLSTAKLIVDFIKTHTEQLAVRGAVIDGQLLDQHHVEQLASLPPKPMLLAQVVATIESPIAQVIMTIEQLIGDLSWVMEQAALHRPAPPKAEPASPDASTNEQQPPTGQEETPA